MGKLDLDVAKRFFDSLSNVDLEGCAACMHQEGVFHEPPGLPYSGDWVGPKGVEDLAHAVFAEWRIDILGVELFDADARILAMVESRFTSQRSGAQSEQTVVEVHTYVDGLIRDADIFYQDTQVLAALHSVTGREVTG
jgi:ketosteroid isomerase-like protein